ATVFRRGSKAAQAMSIGDSATATAASHTSTFAANFAPLIETAQAVAVQAPTALPTIGKAAIGIGMLVVATAPATAPAIVDRITSDSDSSADASTDPEAGLGDPVVVDDEITNDLDSNDDVVAEGDEASIVVAPGESGAAGDSTEYGAQSAAALGVDEPAPTETTLPTLVASNPDLGGGSLRTDSLTITSSGPRFDLDGSATLVIDGETMSGTLTGRVSFMTDPDPDGRQRIEGLLTFTTADGPVEIRLAGYATANGESYAMSGVFRASTDLPLVDSGSFSGSFGSSLQLSLND
ncbi:MAG: hypothetical protein ACKOD2_07595, partial [Ilumatobacteraceae bacterium]